MGFLKDLYNDLSAGNRVDDDVKAYADASWAASNGRGNAAKAEQLRNKLSADEANTVDKYVTRRW